MGRAPFTGGGGLDEVQIPGVRTQESLRLPTRLERPDARLGPVAQRRRRRALSGRPRTSRFQAGSNVTNAQAQNAAEAVDRRERPASPGDAAGREARSTSAAGRRRDPSAPDPRWTGSWGCRGTGASRHQPVRGHPRANRASSAFDGDARTAWIVGSLDGRASRSIAWSGPRAGAARALHGSCRGPAAPTRSRASVRVRTAGQLGADRGVAPDGAVALRQPIVSRRCGSTCSRRSNPVGPRGRTAALGHGHRRDAACPGCVHPAAHGEVPIRLRGDPSRRPAGRSREPRGVRRSGRPRCGPRARPSRAAVEQATEARAGRGTGADGRPARETSVQGDDVGLASPAPVPLPGGGGGRCGPRDQTRARPARVPGTRPGWRLTGRRLVGARRKLLAGLAGARARTAPGKERDLGAPVPIDGFANGWPVSSPDAQRLAFTFGAPGHREPRVPDIGAGGPRDAGGVRGAVDPAPAAAAGTRLCRGRRRGPRFAAGRRPRIAPVASLLGSQPWRSRLHSSVGLVAGLVFAWRAGPPVALGRNRWSWSSASRSGRLLLVALYGLVVVPILYLDSTR